MAKNKFENTRIVGVSSAVPKEFRLIDDDTELFGEEAIKIGNTIGVRKRHISNGSQCASDLCLAAGKKLLMAIDWDPLSIDVLICVTQTPDYFLPATSCILQHSLGLAKSCAAFDVNLGCSGYVYALWLSSSLIASGSANRVLILTGDTLSKLVSPYDRVTCFLFGDAGTATALEKTDSADKSWFELGSDGGGSKNLIVSAGGFRIPHTIKTVRRKGDVDGNVRGQRDLFMNGSEVFSFVLREVPPLFNSILRASGWTVDQVDTFIIHQANLFILQYLAKRLKIPTEKIPLTLDKFGNTSNASIPLTITNHYLGKKIESNLKIVLLGFGVGYSWGAAAITLGKNIIIPELVIVE